MVPNCAELDGIRVRGAGARHRDRVPRAAVGRRATGSPPRLTSPATAR